MRMIDGKPEYKNGLVRRQRRGRGLGQEGGEGHGYRDTALEARSWFQRPACLPV